MAVAGSNVDEMMAETPERLSDLDQDDTAEQEGQATASDQPAGEAALPDTAAVAHAHGKFCAVPLLRCAVLSFAVLSCATLCMSWVFVWT